MQIRISAIIPTYNDAGRLRCAIASVLAQTEPPVELIVVDDGSTDDTRAVAASFGDRVRYVHQANQGPSAARNTGIRISTGDYIAFLDSDDSWLPEKLARQREAFTAAPESALCYTGVRWVNEQDGSHQDQEANDPAAIWPALRFHNCITGSASAVCVKRDCLDSIGGFCEQLTAHEDWDVWFRIARRHPVTAVREPLTVINVRPESISVDVERMQRNMELFLNRTPLEGLTGISRVVWRQRFYSVELFRLAMMLRTRRQPGELRYLLRSIAAWPSPFFQFVRFKAIAYTLGRLGQTRR